VLQVKIGIQTASLKQPFKKALHTAARLGAQAVEIDARNEILPSELSQTGVRQLRKMLDDLNLRVSAVAFPTRRGYDTLERLDQRIEATKQAMQLAYRLGGSVVVNQVGQVPDTEDDPAWGILLAALADLSAFGQHIGARFAARTGTEAGQDLQRLIDALSNSAIGVDLDPGNLIVNGFSATEAVKILASHVVHVHATDAVRDLAIGRGIRVPLGQGSADYPELLGVLEEHQYRGYFTIEREGAQRPLAEIADAVAYLKSL
jgi:sugar phosphate isomerase/epimerase